MIDINIKAMRFAYAAHQRVNQSYDKQYPYSVHLTIGGVYAVEFIDCLPKEVKVSDAMGGWWLHDTVEDCRLTPNDLLKEGFTMETVKIAFALSNEKGWTRAERANDKYYVGIRETPGAVWDKLIDRLANVHYGIVFDGGMISTYRKEQENFVKKLFLDSDDMPRYQDMIDELDEMLKPRSLSEMANNIN